MSTAAASAIAHSTIDDAIHAAARERRIHVAHRLVTVAGPILAVAMLLASVPAMARVPATVATPGPLPAPAPAVNSGTNSGSATGDRE